MRILLTIGVVILFAGNAFAQTPGGVAGSVFWVKAGTGVTGTSNVSAWADQSGNGNNLTQGTGANQPSLLNPDVNFNPSIHFSGTSQFMTLGIPPANLNTTVFAIGVPTANTTWRTMLRGSVSDHPILIETGSSRLGYYDNDNIGFMYSGLDWSANEAAVVGLEMRAADVNFRKNGTQGASITSINLAGLNLDYLGNYQGGTQNFGRIAETIIFTTGSPLTATEKNKIESYLGIKYGVTIAHDYLATDGSTIWNATSNATYQNDVAGIGRDDNTALSQPKSISVNVGAGITLDKGGPFGSDRNFILWGNNASTGTSNNVSSSFILRTNRIWKVAVTGTPGVVSFSADLAALGFPNTGSATDYALLIDTDNDFSSGAAVHTTGASLVGNTLSFTGVNFADGNLFALAAANVVLPGGASGLNVWLKANSGPLKAGAIPAANGDAIVTWKDKSGNGRDYTAVVGPTLQGTTLLNFNPTVEILNGGFDAPAGSELTNDWTMFFISQKLASDDDGRLFEGHTGNNLWAHWSNYTNSIYIEGNPSNYNSGIATQSGIRNWHLHSYKRNSGSGQIEARADGTSLTTFNGTNSGIGIRIDIDAGNFAGESSDARVGEMIVYNSSLTATEVNKVESYLGIKYGMMLSHDYLASDASVIWSATANATYHHDVAGIGRDDNTGLDQQKSLSINAGAAVTLDKGGAFGTDKSYILWGNDAATSTSLNVPVGYSIRTNRIWKVAALGTPGSVNFSVDLASLGFSVTGTAADYALLKDTDTDFSSGATAVTSGASLVGNILSFAGVNFSNGDFFSIGANNIPIPGGVSGLVFWVKANAGVTGTTNVSNWQDQSGNNNHATQGVAANQPSFLNPDANFNPSINFSGSSHVMNITTPPANLNSTVFTVAIPAVNSNWRTMFRGTASDHPIIVESGSNRLGYYDGDNGGFQYSGLNWAQNEVAVVSLEMRNANVNFRKNGTQGGPIATINLAGLNLDYFGNYQAGTQNFGRIAETIIYTTVGAMTATEKNKVESYLAIKYGVTLTHDYLASDGSVVWDVAANAAYSNDITGIGRDDNTGLSQPKSLSVNTGAGVTLDKGGAFGTNKSFIVWGSDGATSSSLNTPPTYSVRTNRIWKVTVTGTPGVVNFSADLTALGFPNTGSAADYALLIDNDTDFSTVATTHTTGATLVGNTISFTNVSLASGNFFALAAGNVPLPGGTPGLNVWLKANSGPEKAGGIPAANGDAIVTWKDKSGNGRDYIAAAGPTLQGSTLNFNPTVEILNGGFDAPAGSELLNDWTMFFISQKLASDDDGRLFEGHTGNNLWAHWSTYTNSIYIEGNPSNYNSGIATQTGNRNWHLHSYKRTAGSGQIEARADGTSLSTFAGTNSGSGLRIGIDRGTYATGAGESTDARVGEMILYNSSLTTIEVNKIESYLGVKYGMMLSHDYLASDGTVLWNATTNATYHHDVAGIGRDDNTGLSQPKSLSINTNAAVTLDKGGAFGTDKDFILWGNDTQTGSSTNVPGAYVLRTKRVWKVAVNGAPGLVGFSVDLTAVGIPNSGSASDYALLIDNDTDFSSGSTTHTTGAALVGSILSFSGVNFGNNNFFTIAAANVSAPGGVTGVIFWVKAGTGVTGTTNVSSWADQSGSSNDVTQGIVANQPALVSNDINSNPTINFSGSSFVMNFTSPPAALNATVFSVGVPVVNTSWRTMLRAAAGNDHPLIIELGSDRLGYYDADNVGFKNSGLAWSQNEIAIGTLEMRSGDVNFRKNGTQGASITTINLAGQNLDYFGNYQAGTQNFGKIAEAMVYSTPSALTATEKSKIESYLGVKYGVTLTHDYLASDATVVWNATTNATFHNNVTGIARDNATGLDQRKSKSVNTNAVVTIDKGGAFPTDKSYIIWGDNNAAMAASGVSDYPASQGLIGRIARSWKIATYGAPGTIAVRFDLSSVPGGKTAADLRLLIDRNLNGLYADETVGGSGVVNGAVDLGGGVFEFAGIPLNNSEQISIGTVSNNTPLPITLNSFTAKATDDGVKLDWSTSTEVNNDYFNVERSLTGIEFEVIVKIKGAGNSHETRKYGYLDLTAPAGVNYYRLRQTDFDGQTTYSKIVSVNVEVAPEEIIKIYPNPSTGKFSVEGQDLDNAEITLFNVQGQRVPFKSTLTTDLVQVETTELPKGLYILRITRNGKSTSKKVVLD